MIEKIAKKMDKTFSTGELNISSGHVNQVFARLSRGITGPSLVQYWPEQTCGEYYYTICIISVFSRYSLKRVCNYFGCREVVAFVEGADAPKLRRTQGWRWRFRCLRGCRGGTLCKWCIRGNWAIVRVRNDDFPVNFEPWPWLTDHHTVEPLLHDSISRNLCPSFDPYLLHG